jgi:predicted ATP-grasp superfamily ATP-dependent carboligase
MNSVIAETRNILIVDESVAPLTLAVLRCLGKFKEYKLHVLSFSKTRNPQFRYSKYASSFERTDFIDEEKTFDLIKKKAEEIKAHIIIPVNEKIVKILSMHMDDCLGLCRLPPMPEINTLNIVRHKWELYNWLFKNNYAADKPVLLSEAIKDESTRTNLCFPLLIKPNWGSGGKGIRRIENLHDFESVSGSYPDPHEYVIQKIIPGFDIDISFLARDGRIMAYTIQQSIEKKNRYAYARSLKFTHNEELLGITADIVKKLNYSGIAHLDFRYDTLENNYKLVDFNARYWSSLLGSLSAGINFPYLAVCGDEMISRSEYNSMNYYMDLNVLRLLWKKIPLRNSEFYYDLRDPAPLFLDLFYRAAYHLKNFIIPKKL